MILPVIHDGYLDMFCFCISVLNPDLQSSGGLHPGQVREEKVLRQGSSDHSSCEYRQHHLFLRSEFWPVSPHYRYGRLQNCCGWMPFPEPVHQRLLVACKAVWCQYLRTAETNLKAEWQLFFPFSLLRCLSCHLHTLLFKLHINDQI